jgi:hypothetical protein
MSVQELKSKIEELTAEERSSLLEWLDDYEAEAWDRQIASDVRSGRFRTIIERLKEQKQAGQCKPL